MKQLFLLLLVTGLTACDRSETPTPQPDAPTVEELAADPERLKELCRECKTDRQNLGDMLCNRVAEATNRRFFGDGKVAYTPQETSPKF